MPRYRDLLQTHPVERPDVVQRPQLVSTTEYPIFVPVEDRGVRATRWGNVYGRERRRDYWRVEISKT